MISEEKSEQLLIAELQLILAEKRTYLASLRTGLAVFSAPLSLLLFLVATAQFHRLFYHTKLAAASIAILIVIAGAGLIEFWVSYRKIKRLEAITEEIKAMNSRVREIMV
ncbi:MAG: hypothetical protein AAB495_01545 [Patescibacteria group bacterium]